MYGHARKHNYFEGVSHIDNEILSTTRNLVSGFEVESRSAYEWRTAILKSYDIFRKLRNNNGGVVEVDLNKREIVYQAL